MHPARLTFEEAPAFIPVPAEMQHRRIEVILWPLEALAEPANAARRRRPPPELAGKGHERGDIMASLSAGDWGQTP